MAADWSEETGNFMAWGNGPGGETIVAPTAAATRDSFDSLYLFSRQDCDDLIELLRVVRERLP
jgi:hypothetical protein